MAGFDGTDQVIIAAGKKYVFVLACDKIGEIAGRIRFIKRSEDGYVGLLPENNEKLGYSDSTENIEEEADVDELETLDAPSRFSINPVKAEAWAGRLFSLNYRAVGVPSPRIDEPKAQPVV